MDDCPKITLKGWWWKRFFPSYRRRSFMLNKLMQHDWENGLKEKMEKAQMDFLLYGRAIIEP